MTKEEWIWVAIRIFGIYLVVLAITAIPGIVNSGIMTNSLWYINRNPEKRVDTSPAEIYEQLKKDGKSMTEEDVSSVLSKVGEVKAFYNEISQNIFESNLASLISNVVKFILFLTCGLYFLKSGRFLFDLISNDTNQKNEILSAEQSTARER